MLNVNDTQQLVALAGSALAALAALTGWLRWVRPRYKAASNKVWGALETLTGRDAIIERSTGRVIDPPLPSMGVRLETLEVKTDDLTAIVASIAKSHAVMDNHELRLQDHDTRIEKLEAAAVERVVSKAESAAAWRAMEAVARPDPPEFTD